MRPTTGDRVQVRVTELTPAVAVKSVGAAGGPRVLTVESELPGFTLRTLGLGLPLVTGERPLILPDLS